MTFYNTKTALANPDSAVFRDLKESISSSVRFTLFLTFYNKNVISTQSLPHIRKEMRELIQARQQFEK
jgi:hypothetical protein